MNNYENNINPSAWGGCVWKFIFSFISVYPENADKNHIDGALKYFNSLINLLPCSGCRESYSIFIKEPDTNIDNLSHFSTRDKIIQFVFNLREKVNAKIDKEYCITLQYFKKKLDIMICNKDNKLSGYANIICEVPFIHNHMCEKVFKYMNEKTKYNYQKTIIIINKSKKFLSYPDFNVDNKDFIFFFYRNVKCRNIYSQLFNSIQIDKISFDESFIKYKHLYDLLLFWGCTFLTSEQLSKFISL
jgi:hypothetical protein